MTKRYDIPPKSKRQCKNGSSALQSFYFNYFVAEMGLTRGEVDLTFLKDLKPQEAAVAKDLVRRNLRLGYSHIIEGAAALGDLAAVPQLERMLASESDLSRQLVIAGSLWKLVKHRSFPDCIQAMVSSTNHSLKQAHIDQIVWLGDERAFQFLVALLNDEDKFVRFLALSRLNELEFKQQFLTEEMPRSAQDYLSRQEDAAFVKTMVENLIALNAENSI